MFSMPTFVIRFVVYLKIVPPPKALLLVESSELVSGRLTVIVLPLMDVIVRSIWMCVLLGLQASVPSPVESMPMAVIQACVDGRLTTILSPTWYLEMSAAATWNDVVPTGT